jgi:hypothetical protein
MDRGWVVHYIQYIIYSIGHSSRHKDKVSGEKNKPISTRKKKFPGYFIPSTLKEELF